MNPTILTWKDGAGFACDDAVAVGLRVLPHFLPTDVVEVDFVYGDHADVLVGDGPKRPMTPQEQRLTVEHLTRMSAEARDAMDGPGTILVIVTP